MIWSSSARTSSIDCGGISGRRGAVIGLRLFSGRTGNRNCTETARVQTNHPSPTAVASQRRRSVRVARHGQEFGVPMRLERSEEVLSERAHAPIHSCFSDPPYDQRQLGLHCSIRLRSLWRMVYGPWLRGSRAERLCNVPRRSSIRRRGKSRQSVPSGPFVDPVGV